MLSASRPFYGKPIQIQIDSILQATLLADHGLMQRQLAGKMSVEQEVSRLLAANLSDAQTDNFQALQEALAALNSTAGSLQQFAMADCREMLLEKAKEIAGVTWVERVTKALPATDIEGLAALVDSLVIEGRRIEQIAMMMSDGAEFYQTVKSEMKARFINRLSMIKVPSTEIEAAMDHANYWETLRNTIQSMFKSLYQNYELVCKGYI